MNIQRRIEGTWYNQHGSRLELDVESEGRLRGTFQVTGAGGARRGFPVTGFVAGELVGFTVAFGDLGSVTSWVGHLIDDGEPALETLWQMAMHLPEAGPGQRWKWVHTGADQFTRSETDARPGTLGPSHPTGYRR